MLSPELTEAAWRAGRERYPGLTVDRQRFAAYLEERPAAAGADAERCADLYLACACLHGVAGAADELTRRVVERTPTHLGRLATGSDVAEVMQELTVALLVERRIGDYAGRAPLDAWLRIVATRLALKQRRGATRRATWERAAEDGRLDVDGELQLMKAAYREPFARAFAAAAAALPRPQRALLRLHYVEGVTTARLAELGAVSRPTIVRRLTEAREALVGGVTARLRALVGLGEEELEQVLRMVRSQLDLDLTELLRSTSS